MREDGCCITTREQDPPLGVTHGDRSELCQSLEIQDDRGRTVATVTTEDGRLVLKAATWARLSVTR